MSFVVRDSSRHSLASRHEGSFADTDGRRESQNYGAPEVVAGDGSEVRRRTNTGDGRASRTAADIEAPLSESQTVMDDPGHHTSQNRANSSPGHSSSAMDSSRQEFQDRPLRASKAGKDEHSSLLGNSGAADDGTIPPKGPAAIPDGDDGHAAKKEEGGCSILPKGGIIASGFNLASATLGAGTVALPSAMYGSGYLLGSIILVLVCLSTVFSVRLLVKIFEKTGYSTYEEMAKYLVGPKFEKLTAFLIVAFCWGITIVYIVLLGDLMENLGSRVDGWPTRLKGEWGRHLMTIIFWAMFLLPLSLLKEINSLRYTSVIGIAATIFLVVAIIVHEEQDPGSKQDLLKPFRFDIGMVASLPIFIFSYCCQTNTFEIYAEMEPRTSNRMTLATALSMGTVTLVYITAGVAGVANFGSETHGNILNDYDPMESAYLFIAYISISFTLTSAYPLCIFPTRDAIVQLMGHESAYTTPWQTRMLVCLLLAFLSLVAAIFVPGVKILFGLLGGVCGSSLSFIWPALFTLRSPGYTKVTAGALHYYTVCFFLVIGVIIGILGTVMSIVDEFG